MTEAASSNNNKLFVFCVCVCGSNVHEFIKYSSDAVIHCGWRARPIEMAETASRD